MRRYLLLSLFAAALAMGWALPAAAVDLHLQAEIAKGAKQPVKQPVEWSVTRMFDDKQPGAVAATAREPAPNFSLEPGIYLVKAKLGLATAEQTVELTKGPVSARLNFNAGIVRLNMIRTAGAPVIKDSIRWELFPYTRGGSLTTRIADVSAPAAEFILPASGYVVRATYDGTISELVIPLEAGQTFNYTLNLYAGTAKLVAAGEGGGAFKDPVAWEIVRANDRNELVASATAPNHQLTLREGRYIVLARQGSFAGEAPLEVKAGRTASAKVTMKTITPEQAAALEQAAKTRVQLAQAALAPKPAPQPTTRVASAAGQGASGRTLAETLRAADGKQSTAAAPADTEPAPAAATAAAPQTAAAALPAAQPASASERPASVKVSAIGRSGGTFKDPVVWEVVRADDRTALVATATSPVYVFALPPGEYVVLGRQAPYAGEATVEVKAGEAAAADVRMASLNAEEIAALEQASSQRVELAEAAQAAKAQDAAAPEPAPTAAEPPVGAAQALAAADAPQAQAVPASFQASSTRSLFDTLKEADALQKSATRGAAAQAEEAAAGTDAAAADVAAATETAAEQPAVAALPTEAAEEPAEPLPDGSVSVSAWSKNVEKFRDAVEWEIRRVQPSGAVLPEVVASNSSATQEFSLPPGSYVIWGRQGSLIGKQKFEVAPDEAVAIRVFMQTPRVADAPAESAAAEDAAGAASSGG